MKPRFLDGCGCKEEEGSLGSWLNQAQSTLGMQPQLWRCPSKSLKPHVYKPTLEVEDRIGFMRFSGSLFPSITCKLPRWRTLWNMHGYPLSGIRATTLVHSVVQHPQLSGAFGLWRFGVGFYASLSRLSFLAMDASPHPTLWKFWVSTRQNAHDNTPSTVKTSPLSYNNFLDLSWDPYVRHPAQVYMSYLLPPFLVLIFTFIFALYVHLRGEVPASRSLSNFTTSNPRLTAQIVTIFSSFLTAAVRWGLSGSAALLARKCILNRSRSILEIELFSCLKNISVVCDLKRQKRMTFLTWLLVAICGLLTSGFVTLLNPLPISIITRSKAGMELNLAADSNGCIDWYSRIMEKLRPGTCHSSWSYQDFEYSSCSASEVDILDAVKASMRHKASRKPSDKYSRLVSVYPDLNDTRVLGSTSGSLIPGPDGIQVFDIPTLSPTWKDYNYTLKLQGLWADVSCSYDKGVAFNVEFGQIHNGSEIEYKLNCPNSSLYETGNLTLVTGGRIMSEAVRVCPMESGESAILFRYFWNTTKSTEDASDYLACRFPGRLGDVDAILDAGLQAFTPLRQDPPAAVRTTLLDMVTAEVVRMVLFHFNDPETHEKLRNPRFLYQNRKGPLYNTDSVTSIMQGMFEYEATRMRLMLTAMSKAEEIFAPPEECLRDVEIVVLKRTIGWNIQQSTILGLIPLLVVACISFTMCGVAICAPGDLPLFDPTSPASLIAATSFGSVAFPAGSYGAASVGESQNEGVLLTRVWYGKQESGWGLKSV